MIILKVSKNQGFTLSLDDTLLIHFLKNHRGEGGQPLAPPPTHPAPWPFQG